MEASACHRTTLVTANVVRLCSSCSIMCVAISSCTTCSGSRIAMWKHTHKFQHGPPPVRLCTPHCFNLFWHSSGGLVHTCCRAGCNDVPKQGMKQAHTPATRPHLYSPHTPWKRKPSVQFSIAACHRLLAAASIVPAMRQQHFTHIPSPYPSEQCLTTTHQCRH